MVRDYQQRAVFSDLKERQVGRALFFATSFVYHHILLPEWPQTPAVVAGPAGPARQRRYTFAIGNQDVQLSPNWIRMRSSYRERLSGTDVEEIKTAMGEILDAII